MTSIELASAHHKDGTPMVPEVCIYFSGHLLRGNRSTKQNADEFNAFDSFNYPHLCEAGVNFTFDEHRILVPDYSKPLVTHTQLDNNVIIFSLFPGMEEGLMHHLFDAFLWKWQRATATLADEAVETGIGTRSDSC